MIPAEFSNFLVASTQASAALIGLLFVSVSIAPERVFGPKAEAARRALALSSFTALANVFFVSFGSLVPHFPIGVMVVIAGGIAASQTLSLLQHLPSWRREHLVARGISLFVVSAAIYAYEIAIGVHLLQHPDDPEQLTSLLGILLGAFAIGLARAWELLGASEARGLATTLFAWLRHHGEANRQDKRAAAMPADRPAGKGRRL